MVECQNLSPQQHPRTRQLVVLFRPRLIVRFVPKNSTYEMSLIVVSIVRGCDDCDDDFMFMVRGSPTPVSWFGSHTERLTAAMAGDCKQFSRHRKMQKLRSQRIPYMSAWKSSNKETLCIYPSKECVQTVPHQKFSAPFCTYLSFALRDLDEVAEMGDEEHAAAKLDDLEDNSSNSTYFLVHVRLFFF
nr:hypothetical protein [Tanacetum cinerariifolium]